VLDEIQSQRSEELLNDEGSSSLMMLPIDSSQDLEDYKSSHDDDEDEVNKSPEDQRK
jgi:hypothetical protein